MPALGIGIVTYNRCDLLAETLDCVRAMTQEPDALLVVADDGSTDNTVPMALERKVPVVTGANRGVAWNKNRALFILCDVLRCDVILLLEDDTQPVEPGWERAWMQATRRWGHINYASESMAPHIVSGTGGPDDPFVTTALTAQCCGYAREAITWGGYLDPRFRGFGHEHVEHTSRLCRAGYGGRLVHVDGVAKQAHEAIGSGVAVRAARTHFRQEDADRNRAIGHELLKQNDYRAPWRDDDELRQFRGEIEAALQLGPAAFRLHGSGGAASAVPVSGLRFVGHA